jgi:hypothetical protein
MNEFILFDRILPIEVTLTPCIVWNRETYYQSISGLTSCDHMVRVKATDESSLVFVPRV